MNLDVSVFGERRRREGAGLGTSGGAERLGTLLDRYGDARVTEAIAEMRRLAAKQMRAMIGLIPKGTYQSMALVNRQGA